MVVLVRDKLPKAGLAREAIVPQQVNGVKTDVIQVGELRALQARTEPLAPGARRGQHRALPDHRRARWAAWCATGRAASG